MVLGDGIRRNIADVSAEERSLLVKAIIALNHKFYPGSSNDTPTAGHVSYWFKQDEIHDSTHVHGCPAFLPWHRELVNFFEKLLREEDSRLSMHYWDWTEDPQKLGPSGSLSLFTTDFMGSTGNGAGGTGLAEEPWKSNFFYAPDKKDLNGNDIGVRDDTGNPADPPWKIERNVQPGAPVPKVGSTGAVTSDEVTLNSTTYVDLLSNIQGPQGPHVVAHGWIGPTMSDQHTSFRDPFVFLLHSNVDRLFALWQLRDKNNVNNRLNPDTVYDADENSMGSGVVSSFHPNWGILSPVEPWAGTEIGVQDSTTGTVQGVVPVRPWAPPENQQFKKNHKHWTIVKPPHYDTNPIVIQVLNPGNVISFNDVPEGETTIRAAHFQFVAPSDLTFTVTSGPSAPFKVFSTLPVPAGDNPDDIWSEARVWFSMKGGTANTSPPPSDVTIHCNESGENFIFHLSGHFIARPTVGIMMALDQSGSMNDPAGSTGLNRVTLLKQAAEALVSVTQPGNGLGLIRFDTKAYAVNDPTWPGLGVTTMDSDDGVFGTNRKAVNDAVANHKTNTAGNTSIGAGLLMARSVLNALPANSFTNEAIVVFTDGLENTAPFIADVKSQAIDTRTFAVGLGSAQQISTAALTNITNGSGGYTRITGPLGPSDEDFFLLTKYFLQILAGETNNQIVKDPTGFLPRGKNIFVNIPFDINETDIEVSVVLLCDLPALDFTLLTPGGKFITPATAKNFGVRFSGLGATTMHYRFLLPVNIGAGEAVGTWNAVLRVDEALFREYCGGTIGMGPTVPRAVTATGDVISKKPLACQRGGIRYSVSTYAWSNLRMQADLIQSSLEPGNTMTVRTLLSEYDLPLAQAASVKAEVQRPDATTFSLTLTEVQPGVHEASFKADLVGVYRIHVTATGVTTRGTPFTREQLLTGVAVKGGDGPLPGSGQDGSGNGGSDGHGCSCSGPNTCDLLKCVLGNKEVDVFLKKHELDADSLLKSLEKCCKRKEVERLG